jgi:hypothetical protein
MDDLPRIGDDQRASGPAGIYSLDPLDTGLYHVCRFFIATASPEDQGFIFAGVVRVGRPSCCRPTPRAGMIMVWHGRKPELSLEQLREEEESKRATSSRSSRDEAEVI